MNKKRKKTNKTINIICFIAIVAVIALIHFLPLHASEKVHSQYVLADCVKGECLYKCPNASGWEKFCGKSIALPIDSYIITKNNSTLCLVFSKDTKINIPENTQIKVRYRHKRTDNPVENMYKLAYRGIKNLLSKNEDFRLNRPTVLSTI